MEWESGTNTHKKGKSMALMKITGKTSDGSFEKTEEYDFGDDLDQMVALFGKDTVYTNAKQSMVIRAQSILRSGGTLEGWKPGASAARTKDPEAAILANFAKLPPEQQLAIIQKIKERQAKK